MESIELGASHDLYDSSMFFREGVTAKFHHSRICVTCVSSHQKSYPE